MVSEIMKTIDEKNEVKTKTEKNKELQNYSEQVRAK